jgi:hypothetical protein
VPDVSNDATRSGGAKVNGLVNLLFGLGVVLLALDLLVLRLVLRKRPGRRLVVAGMACLVAALLLLWLLPPGPAH